jgi:hypothetical protein
MLAYCLLKDGSIHFAEAKALRSVVIATHSDSSLLKEAVERVAWTGLETKGSVTINHGLSVPWFERAKDEFRERECIERFAARVKVQMDLCQKESLEGPRPTLH